MRTSLIIMIAFLLLSSCKRNQIRFTKEYVYYSKGFPTGLTIKLLKVYEFDEEGLPLNFDDSLRIDLNYSKAGKVKNKLWFQEDNRNYYWTLNLDGNFKTMPISFEEGNWYGVWSGEFKEGVFKTDKYYFYLYLDSSGRLNVFEKVQKLNM